MTTRNRGDWSRLTDWLKRVSASQNEIILTDDEIAQITGSVDKRKSPSLNFPVNHTKKNSIMKRAKDAGFSVEYDRSDRRKKIFRRIATS